MWFTFLVTVLMAARVGDKLPDLPPDAAVYLGQARPSQGGFVLIGLWSTACDVCEPAKRAWDELASIAGVRVLRFNVDEKKPTLVGPGTWWDEGRKLTAALRPQLLPITYLYSADGKLVEIYRGSSADELQRLKDEVTKRGTL